jgi:hypothetical protein
MWQRNVVNACVHGIPFCRSAAISVGKQQTTTNNFVIQFFKEYCYAMERKLPRPFEPDSIS